MHLHEALKSHLKQKTKDERTAVKLEMIVSQISNLSVGSIKKFAV